MFDVITDNLYQKFCFLPNLMPQSDVQSLGHLTAVNSHLMSDMFNTVFHHHLPAATDINAMIELYQSERLPFAYWMRDTDSIALASTLDNAQLTCVEDELAMGLSLKHVNCPTQSKNPLTIKQIHRQADVEDWITVLSTLLKEEAHPITTFYRDAAPYLGAHQDTIKCFIGMVNDKPVTTCALFYTDTVAGIYDMITVPEAQRRGIATDMMWHAIRTAQADGYETITLGASEQGAPVYHKIGFVTHGAYKIYSRV